MRFALQRVRYIPAELQPGVLYVSKEFEIAVHLCPCGCGAKIRMPLGPTEWVVRETRKGPTVRPSIGNWQEACRSHYWIRNGEIEWAEKWSPEQIAEGWLNEQELNRVYFETRASNIKGLIPRIWQRIKRAFGRD
jgi:Family of unknown function (DUF6527)